MSTVDTSSWNPDADLNTAIEGIPLNSNAGIAQTWKVIAILMAAMKGDTDAIKAMISVMEGATASADGKQGLVPAPQAGDQDKVLKGDGTWGTLSASDIPNIDASKIASGTIDLARLPAGALERLVTVADQTARYALTTADVQLGDTVKQLDTGAMYIVVDTSKLGQADGYVEFTAGSATSVPWSGVTGKPSTFTPSSHTHGNVTNDGKLSTASRAVVTDGNKSVTVSSVTATELGYLSGVTSAVQTQLNAKAADSAVVHKAGDETVSGVKTFSDRIELPNSRDAAGAADNRPALIIGPTAGNHLEIDSNELMAKKSGTETSPLYLNADGGDVYVGGNTENYKSVTGRGKGSSTVPVYTGSDGIVRACSGTLDVSISGNAATATKATQDASGRSISTGFMWRGSYQRIEGTSSDHESLNDFKTAGFYNVKTAYVDNCPSGIGIDAVLLVYPWSGGTYCTQEITESAASGDSRRWLRKYNQSSDSWSAWKQTAFVENYITDAQIAAMFENDGVDPTSPPVAHPERAVLCGDNVWRYFEQIAFPN